MFEDLHKRFQERRKQIEDAFGDIGDETAKIFVNEAKSRTERKKLVDTGNYKRSWLAYSASFMHSISVCRPFLLT